MYNGEKKTVGVFMKNWFETLHGVIITIFTPLN